MSEEVDFYKMRPGPGKGNGKMALDKLYEQQRGTSSNRTITEQTDELDNLLIIAVDKYRKHGFTPSTTFDIIRKDGEYQHLFGGRTIPTLSIRFCHLVRLDRTEAIVPDNSVVQGLFGGAEPIGVGDLVENFLDLASDKFASKSLSVFLPTMKEEFNKNK